MGESVLKQLSAFSVWSLGGYVNMIFGVRAPCDHLLMLREDAYPLAIIGQPAALLCFETPARSSLMATLSSVASVHHGVVIHGHHGSEGLFCPYAGQPGCSGVP